MARGQQPEWMAAATVRMGRKPGKRTPGWARHTGMGVEFAAALAGFGLLGYWVDRHYQTGPWGVLIGAGLGMVGGMYNLVRESLAAFREADREAREQKNGQERE